MSLTFTDRLDPVADKARSGSALAPLSFGLTLGGDSILDEFGAPFAWAGEQLRGHVASQVPYFCHVRWGN